MRSLLSSFLLFGSRDFGGAHAAGPPTAHLHLPVLLPSSVVCARTCSSSFPELHNACWCKHLLPAGCPYFAPPSTHSLAAGPAGHCPVHRAVHRAVWPVSRWREGRAIRDSPRPRPRSPRASRQSRPSLHLPRCVARRPAWPVLEEECSFQACQTVDLAVSGFSVPWPRQLRGRGPRSRSRAIVPVGAAPPPHAPSSVWRLPLQLGLAVHLAVSGQVPPGSCRRRRVRVLLPLSQRDDVRPLSLRS